ncbi:hypothetical protein NCS52_01213600 [Fusarium sp. LHS14.1]|nr:hypothetical protein NCS52_01213600 [Fusarium sp. LHS14.1]
MAKVGQSRRKKPRHIVIPLEIVTPRADGNDFQLEQHPVDGQRPDAPEPRSPHRLFQLNRLGILGVELSDRTLQIVHFIAAESEYINQPFHSIWVRIGFSDPTTLHLSMATTLLLWNRKNNDPVLKAANDMEAVRYYSKALKDLSTRLSDPFDCTSAGVVATIIGCLCHDISSIRCACILYTNHMRQVHIGDWGRWSTHVDGEASEVLILGEMIRLTCLMLLSRLKGLFSLNTLDMVTLWANFMTTLSLPVMDTVTTHLNDLGLWALVTCALIQPGDGMEELLSHIEAAMRAKGIADMRGAIDLARALIWIDAIEGQGEVLLAGKMDSIECKRM